MSIRNKYSTDKPFLEVLLFDELAQPLSLVRQCVPYADPKFFHLSQQPTRGNIMSTGMTFQKQSGLYSKEKMNLENHPL